MLRQAGAIPYRRQDDGWEFLLVTSQRGNWIFPKGIVEPEETPEEAAAKECREEAGIRGRILPRALGSYAVRKWKHDCSVEIYLLHYQEDVEPWEEKHIRERRWCTFQEASGMLKKPELRQILSMARNRLEGDSSAARAGPDGAGFATG